LNNCSHYTIKDSGKKTNLPLQYTSLGETNCEKVLYLAMKYTWQPGKRMHSKLPRRFSIAAPRSGDGKGDSN